MSGGLSLARFTECGAHRQGHFMLSSGLHSGDYLQCALYLAEPRRAAAAGGWLAEAIETAGWAPQLVVAPALGGLIIGHETARVLDLPFIFTERHDGEMALRRGFAVAPDQKLVVVEDVVTTGKSTREVISILNAGGARVVGVASLVNRAAEANPFAPLPYAFLLRAQFPTWPADRCPLCEAGRPIDQPGSRPIRS